MIHRLEACATIPSQWKSQQAHETQADREVGRTLLTDKIGTQMTGGLASELKLWDLDKTGTRGGPQNEAGSLSRYFKSTCQPCFLSSGGHGIRTHNRFPGTSFPVVESASVDLPLPFNCRGF